MSMPPPGYRFSTHLPLAPNSRTRKWETVAPLWFELGGKGSSAWVCVPSGFETDLATIPAPARLLFNPGGDVDDRGGEGEDGEYRQADLAIERSGLRKIATARFSASARVAVRCAEPVVAEAMPAGGVHGGDEFESVERLAAGVHLLEDEADRFVRGVGVLDGFRGAR